MSVSAFCYRFETIEELLAQPAVGILGESGIERALVRRWEKNGCDILDRWPLSGPCTETMIVLWKACNHLLRQSSEATVR